MSRKSAQRGHGLGRHLFLDHGGMLNRILLVACVCIIVATVFYLFYWNRLIAWILGFIFRVLYWHQDGPSLWLEIGSIHFSILTGRILLKDLRYHSSNQTIRIVKTELAWRYWIRRPTDETEIGLTFSQDHKALNRSLSCRVQISFQGFEWFLYNRTAAYDNIIAQMRGDAEPAPSPKTSPRIPSSNLISTVKTPKIIQDAVAWFRRQLPNLDPKDLLPLGIVVTKGVITFGNASTSNLLVTEFRRAQGTFGLVPSRSKHDLHKQVLTLSFQDTVMRFAENADYRGSMTAVGELANERIQRHSPTDLSSYLSFKSFTKLWRHLSFFLEPKRAPRRRPSQKGHRKSVEDPTGDDFLTMEYAIERTILKAPTFELCYYTDVAGDVPPDVPEATSEDPYDIGNGDAGPEWGMDIIITRGFLRYGPWADRQRAELQKIFFPPSYHHGFMTPRLQPGDKRAWTAMRIFVELREQTVLNIPFREPSKNWQWDGVVDDLHGPKHREPAWIHLTAGDRSSISYVMPMVAGPKGYEPIFEVHLDTISVTSSLNDIRLVSAESCRIRGDLPSPLRWSDERTWSISVSLRQPVLYLIRDHINMFTDLGKDWVSGPPSDYFKFIPTIYEFQLDLHHFELSLFANDHNIIDKPRTREDNALFVLHGPRLKTEATVPSNVFRPDSTEIRFSVDASNLLLELCLPRWNTYALHVPKEGSSLAKVHTGRIEGSYRYYSDVREEYVDQLKLSITASNVVYKLLGWSVRYFMILKDNYFGSFTQFSTLYEYLNKRERGLPQGDPVVHKYRKGKNNMFQVEMLINVQDGGIIMPVGLPGYEKSCTHSIGHALVLTLPELQLQFRMHDYYMEMTLNVDTLRGRIEPECPEKVGFLDLNRHSDEILVIDGIDITANRLFGPSPRNITYVCIWEIGIGHIRAIASANDGALVMAAIRAFLLNFGDPFNAPAEEFMPPIYPDLTFMKLSLTAVDATWKAGHASLSISLPRGLRLDTNDLGGQFHRKMVGLRLPRVVLRTLLASETNQSSWLEAGEFSGDCNLDIYLAPAGWQDKARAQAIFVQEQDQLTGRAQKMFSAVKRRPSAVNAHISSNPMHLSGVYLPQPVLSSYRRYKGESQSIADKGRRLSRLSNSSQSDADGLSEADRDALLARARSETLTPHLEDDNLTSGDESDTEGLSDSDSDSDWSQLDTPISEAQELFRLYSRLVRHYSARSLNRPYVWDGSPFIQTKGSKVRSSRNPASYLGYLEVKPLNLPPPREDADSTVFRFASREGIEVRITPLILSVLSRLEVDMENIALTPEVSVDAMLISHVNDFQRSKANPIAMGMEPKASYRSFDARIPSLRVLILQHVATPSSATTQPPKSPRSMTSLELQLGGVHVMGRLKSEDNHLSGSFTRLSVAVDADRDISMDEHLLFFSIDQCTTGFAPDNAYVNLGDIVFSVCHTCPRYLMAISESVLEDAKQLKAVRRRWKSSSAARLGIVGHIIDASMDHDAIDPLSAIQPLYLVQSGLPQDLRTDPVFRFLFHLRNSLWHIRERDGHGPLHCAPLSLDQLRPKLESRLITLDPDLEVQCLIPIFPKLRPSFPATLPETRYGFGYASVRVDSFQLMVVDSAGSQSPSGEIASTDITFVARYRLLDFLETVPTYRQLGTSQSSLRNQLAPIVRKLSVSLIIGDTTLRVLSHLMRFAQEILRVRRLYASTFSTGTEESVDKPTPDKFDLNVDVTLGLQQFRAQAVAKNLIFELGSSDLQATTSLFRRQRDLSTTHAVVFEDLFVRARPGQSTKQNDEDILASLALEGGRFTAVNRNEVAAGKKVRLVLGLHNVHFRVPRSALRLYRFIEEWRADFFPEIEATVQALMSELESPPPKVSGTPRSRRIPSVQLHAQVDSFGIFLQVMHGTWLTWEVNNTIFYMHSSIPNTRGYTQTFEMQTESQIFCISPSADGRSGQSKARVKLELPSISVSGSLAGSSIRVITLVNFFEVKVKPSHWDTLLVVQQKFGQDFNDLVSLVQRTREKKSPTSPKAKGKKLMQPLITSLFWKMRGFRIGLEGLASTLYFECLNIDGKFTTSPIRTWSVTLSDLALSLASRASIEPQGSTFNRRQRSAFVTIDVKVNGGTNQEESAREVLKATITKVHAVMQPSSVGEFGDFVDHLQAEMLERKEQRAQEMAAFKLKAQSILKTFELKDKDTDEKPAPMTSWLNKYIIDLTIRNFGVAFPLTLTPDLQLPQSGRHDSGAVKAFLFSIKSLKFSAQRGETGQATMKGFSFQFVSRFRQSMPTDFLGENHQTRNRLVYPEMTAQLRSQGSTMSREVLMRANVSGFILDLDSSIPDYVFSLIDVYRHGKDRVAQLTSTLPPLSAREPKEVMMQTLEKQHPKLPASNFYASLTFLSGKVRLFSQTAATMSKSRSFTNGVTDLTDQQVLEVGAEIFNLPVVSVWVEYRASRKLHNEIGSSILVFKSTVHSSQNTLRPTLLPFITEATTRVESRLRTATKSPRSTEHLATTLGPVPSTPLAFPSPLQEAEPASSMQISFSLRIDQSKLELTCQPDVNVIAGVHWDSGGFVINVSPRARKVTFTGTVGGLTVGLKHGFLSDECVKLDARNLTFSLTFAKMDTDLDQSISFASLVIDTEFLGAVRFSRLQDVLCFKAVWLDHIPILNGNDTSPVQPTAVMLSDSQSLPQKQEFTNVILARIRQVKLDIDLGQSITTVVLDVSDAVIRTKFTDTMNELSLWVGDVSVAGTGNVAGQISVANCLFETIRRKDNLSKDGTSRNRMLELRLTSGPLVAVLESDHQRLVHYRAEPLEVEICDDWSMITPETEQKQRPLLLTFTVNSPEVVAVATVGTIPKLLLYANKFQANLEAQREGASRESQTFRVSRTPKPDNPLSAVAEAMLQSARSRFKEGSGLSYIISQRMSLRLDLLRLFVFPRNMGDVESAQFVARNVRAELNRVVQSHTKRDIHLAFSSMVISRFTQVGHNVPSSPEFSDGREWLNAFLKGSSEADIVGLPSMRIHMESDEVMEDERKILSYHFNSKFVRDLGGGDFGDDIYITLNVGLYSWLTLLRKSLTREMDQVRAISNATGPSTMSSRRKVPADLPSLSIVDSPKSASTPKPFPMSPLSPVMHRFGFPSREPASASLPSSQAWASSPLLGDEGDTPTSTTAKASKSEKTTIIFRPRTRHIERLTMRQLGEATPDVMHPFFMKKAGFSLEDSLPQYVHEYATTPLEEIMEVLQKLYSKQLTNTHT